MLSVFTGSVREAGSREFSTQFFEQFCWWNQSLPKLGTKDDSCAQLPAERNSSAFIDDANTKQSSFTLTVYSIFPSSYNHQLLPFPTQPPPHLLRHPLRVGVPSQLPQISHINTDSFIPCFIHHPYSLIFPIDDALE